jgi:hypothetical protein
MTRLALVALVGLALSACISTAPDDAPVAASASAEARPAATAVTVGEIADGLSITVDDALARADALDGQTVRVAGTVRQVCQARGCWLTFSTARGETLRVVTHGEGEEDREELLFPKDASGSHAEVVGTLTVTEESVERRRHLAEDAGASADEIAAITAPSRAVALVATGARLSPAPGLSPAR